VVPPGSRVPVSATIAPRDRKTLFLDSNRAFACKEIFYLALFEGLHILSQALNGEFPPRGPGRPLASVPRPGDIVVETILYLNAARRTFLELVQAALSDSPILEYFRISAPSPGGVLACQNT
jgi:hypothetical protein